MVVLAVGTAPTMMVPKALMMLVLAVAKALMMLVVAVVVTAIAWTLEVMRTAAHTHMMHLEMYTSVVLVRVVMALNAVSKYIGGTLLVAGKRQGETHLLRVGIMGLVPECMKKVEMETAAGDLNDDFHSLD